MLIFCEPGVSEKRFSVPIQMFLLVKLILIGTIILNPELPIFGQFFFIDFLNWGLGTSYYGFVVGTRNQIKITVFYWILPSFFFSVIGILSVPADPASERLSLREKKTFCSGPAFAPSFAAIWCSLFLSAAKGKKCEHILHTSFWQPG